MPKLSCFKRTHICLPLKKHHQTNTLEKYAHIYRTVILSLILSSWIVYLLFHFTFKFMLHLSVKRLMNWLCKTTTANEINIVRDRNIFHKILTIITGDKSVIDATFPNKVKKNCHLYHLNLEQFKRQGNRFNSRWGSINCVTKLVCFPSLFLHSSVLQLICIYISFPISLSYIDL